MVITSFALSYAFVYTQLRFKACLATIMGNLGSYFLFHDCKHIEPQTPNRPRLRFELESAMLKAAAHLNQFVSTTRYILAILEEWKYQLKYCRVSCVDLMSDFFLFATMTYQCTIGPNFYQHFVHQYVINNSCVRFPYASCIPNLNIPSAAPYVFYSRQLHWF